MTESEKHPLTLSAADAAIVDQLLDRPEGALRLAADAEPQAAAEASALDAQRRQRVQQILSTLGALPEPEAPGDLVARALAAVKNDTLQLRGPERRPAEGEEEAEAGRGMNLSRRLSQLGAVAVAASILVAVLIPGLGQLRQKSLISDCAAHLEHLKNGFASYAIANGGALPKLDNGDGNWLPHPPGVQGHSNTANLLPLIKLSYASVDDLVCPGTRGSFTVERNAREIPDAQRGYSYTNMFGEIQPRWDGKAATLVLADRNPLFGPGACDDAMANSCNHRRSGSNVLAADGSVVFAASPNIGPKGDNIWTVQEGKSFHRGYNGTEVVAAADDVFLAP